MAGFDFPGPEEFFPTELLHKAAQQLVLTMLTWPDARQATYLTRIKDRLPAFHSCVQHELQHQREAIKKHS